ncbi:MAG TPA: hypothetical protein VEV45_24930 [Streptosporangiaceae bacterium]|nr:hypothetical protein [Streptosporangiaceae bacterium]
MSSVFLYVAIVAIWAFVLVPRWLRRHHAQPQPDTEEFYGSESSPDTTERYDETESAAAAEHVQPPRQVAPSRSLPALPRSRMMQARRRLLTVLMVLTAAAGACGGIKVAPFWVCIPPATVLCVYVLLLREASRADAEQAREAAAQAQAAGLRTAARARARQAALAEAFQPSAEIIDISHRVGDQLYDQYADATVRAVGD